MPDKPLGGGRRGVLMAGWGGGVGARAPWLWTFEDRSFLPHGTARDGMAERQPIWLTAADENPNDAAALFLTDGATSALVDRFELCVELFDGNDPAAVAAARTRWTTYLAAGHALTYYQQDEAGHWQKKS